MTTKIVITHVNGTKINQIEQMPLDAIEEILIGRDPSAKVAFDLQRDDLVSRRHAMIRIHHTPEPSFKIADLGSSNGTLVNGTRLTAEAELLPGDIVELGINGPKFTFDLQPRPPALAERTRRVPLAAMAADVTRFAPIPTAPIKRDPPADSARLVPPAARSGLPAPWLYGLAALLAILAIGGGAFYVLSRPVTVAKTEMSPVDIAQKYGNATTYITMQWGLYDQETGKKIFHKKALWKTPNNYAPAYVKLPNGVIVRWLTTEDDNRHNEAIGGEGSGSGFVIDGQGFILTNKHVAAGWKVRYGFQPYEGNNGVLFTIDANFKIVSVSEVDLEDAGALYNWVPDSGGIVFDDRSPVPISASAHQFEGRNAQLDIRFPGQRVSYASRLIRASADADVAEIRVDAVQGLPAVELEPEDGAHVGEKVTVLGYPGISEQTIATIVTNEVGRQQEHEELIPEPTVTDGLIAKIGKGAQQQGAVTTAGTMGDVYQLTVLATGAGNSGGPVFNAAGRVIGLFTYAKTRGAERVTFAVPIRYGRDLVTPQRVN